MRPEVHETEVASTWNALVESLPGYDLRQGFEWGEVRTTSGWRVHRFAIFEDGSCKAAVSILSKPIPGLGCSILYASGGPLMDWKSQGAWKGFAEAVRRVQERTAAIFLRVSPNWSNDESEVRQALVDHGLVPLDLDWTTWNAPRIVMTLDLNGGEEELKRRIRKRFREYISSAPRRGLSVRPAASEEEVRTFHASVVAMGRKKGYPVRGARHFEALWRYYASSGSGVLLLAERAGALVGGLLGARFGRKAYMLYASVHDSSDSARLHQGPLLYWEFIRWAKAAGCEAINWGGSGTHLSPREDDPGFGVYHFKLGFGARLEYLTGYYDLVFRPALYRAFRFAERHLLPLAWDLRARVNR